MALDKKFFELDAGTRPLRPSGTFRQVGLPEWNEILERRGADPASDKMLFTDSQEHAGRALTDLIRHHLRLTRGHVERRIFGPSGDLLAIVDGETVKHLMDDIYDRRRREGHLRYLPLVKHTVERPFEIWEGAHFEKSSRLFLRAYVDRGRVIDHVVVVKPENEWTITSFAIDDPDDRERYRSGTYVHHDYRHEA